MTTNRAKFGAVLGVLVIAGASLLASNAGGASASASHSRAEVGHSTAKHSPAKYSSASRVGSAKKSKVAQSASAFPRVTGGFGSAPKIAFPAGGPPKTMRVEVLHRGTGPVLHLGDLAVVNYVGQIWKGKVFGSSFTGHLPQGLTISKTSIIPGWYKTLPGVHAGTRLLMVLPPVDGYGASGNSQAGITGKDTLVFVVDLVASYGKTAHAPGKASFVRKAPDGVTVTGPVGSLAAIHFAKGSKAPKKVSVTLIDRGSGQKVRSGLVVLQYVDASWGSKTAQSSWKGSGPIATNVGVPGQPSDLNVLVGAPIGSRFILEAPATSSPGSSQSASAVVVDVVAQPKGATLGS